VTGVAAQANDQGGALEGVVTQAIEERTSDR